MRTERAIIWRRLDTAGIDRCAILRNGQEWQLSGTATGLANGYPYYIDYAVQGGTGWHTREVRLAGWADNCRISFDIRRSPGNLWSRNGRPLPAIEGCVDIDLGFTPATNTIAVRRGGLTPGAEMSSTAAWLDDADWTLKPLRQSYRCIDAARYLYNSPDNNFEAELILGEVGLVRVYPELWTAIDRRGAIR